MIMAILRRLVLMLLPVVCFAARPGQTERATVCDSSALPASAQKLLSAKFSEWRPKLVSDMDTDDQQLWMTATHGKECPGIVTGHFETADELSYAILLVPKSNPNAGYRVGVLTKGTPNNDYAWKLIDHAETQADPGLVISKAPSGKYSDWDGNKSVRLKLDGIQVEWMEKGAVLYFWSAGQYHRIRVSD
jgi:hypothetical protein